MSGSPPVVVMEKRPASFGPPFTTTRVNSFSIVTGGFPFTAAVTAEAVEAAGCALAAGAPVECAVAVGATAGCALSGRLAGGCLRCRLLRKGDAAPQQTAHGGQGNDQRVPDMLLTPPACDDAVFQGIDESHGDGSADFFLIIIFACFPFPAFPDGVQRILIQSR